jgi:hypothetical protein
MVFLPRHSKVLEDPVFHLKGASNCRPETGFNELTPEPLCMTQTLGIRENKR